MSLNPYVHGAYLSHHLSGLSRARQTSPLKGLQKYWGKPGLISLAGGLPSPAYFPFATISGEVLASNSFPLESTQESSSLSWLWKLLGAAKEKTTTVTVPSTRSALQYGMSSGLPQLQKIVTEFTDKTLLHAGNTDAWNKVVTTLCNPGEGVLVSKWTYPSLTLNSAMASMQPYGIKPVPVDIDGQGMMSGALRNILTEPHVIYAVPIGENPTGTTTEIARKKEIYQICVEFDIIIVEDDPYYFLQEGPYTPKLQRAHEGGSGPDDDIRFLASLAPSYLKVDYQGRVIRLDTFSKTIAPGCRLGWYTCNPVFAERLERQAETSTQAPCGFGQALVTTALLEWGYEGYIRWLKALRLQYTLRRDFLLDCLAEEFHLEVAPGTAGARKGCEVYHGSVKPKRSITGYLNEKSPASTTLFSFVPPTSGMFLWIKIHFDQHPSFSTLGTEDLEMKLWIALAEGGLLVGPGKLDVFSHRSGHYRISFSNGENDELKKAMEIFSTILKEFMADL
ncbi:PLP-dependent transferase [Mycena sp. CBHHK59/15]|nr:PLP-dependent transferase [Mycena sp. CBHHK59/15]